MHERARRRHSSGRNASSTVQKILKRAVKYHLPLKVLGVALLVIAAAGAYRFLSRMSHPDPRAMDAREIRQVIADVFHACHKRDIAALGQYFAAIPREQSCTGAGGDACATSSMSGYLVANTPSSAHAEPVAIIVNAERNRAVAMVAVSPSAESAVAEAASAVWSFRLQRVDGTYRIVDLAKIDPTSVAAEKQQAIRALQGENGEPPYIEALSTSMRTGGTSGQHVEWKVFGATATSEGTAATIPSEWTVTRQAIPDELVDEKHNIPLLVGMRYADVPEILGAPDRVKTSKLTHKKVWIYNGKKHPLFTSAKVVFDPASKAVASFHCESGTMRSGHRVRHFLPAELLASTPVHICVASSDSIYMIWELADAQYFAEITRSGSRPLSRSMRMINTDTGDMKKYRQLDGEAWLNGRVVQFGQWKKTERRINRMLWFKPVITFDPAMHGQVETPTAQ